MADVVMTKRNVKMGVVVIDEKRRRWRHGWQSVTDIIGNSNSGNWQASGYARDRTVPAGVVVAEASE